MEIARRQFEEEVVRLQVSIREKDKDLQVSFKEYMGLNMKVDNGC